MSNETKQFNVRLSVELIAAIDQHAATLGGKAKAVEAAFAALASQGGQSASAPVRPAEAQQSAIQGVPDNARSIVIAAFDELDRLRRLVKFTKKP